MPQERISESTILDAVAQGFERQFAFTSQLVGFPSTRGAEHAIRDFVHDAWKARLFIAAWCGLEPIAERT